MKWAERMADNYVAEHWSEFHAPARLLAKNGRLKVK
jgi:hypothetical protein